MNTKAVIAMVGLPARGKSTIARKIARTFELDDVTVEIFNNGELRRHLSTENTSSADFFSPANSQGVELREKYSRINLERARTFLDGNGQVAIIDASNVTKLRRATISAMFPELAVLFIECINMDEEVREANLERKLSLKEFGHLSPDEALDSFLKRISHYEGIYEPLQEERNRIVVDSFAGRILQEHISDLVPYYDRIRDLLTTRTVKNLFLVRHGETYYNLEDRIGGDSELTEKGLRQAQSLADYFSTWRIPIIFRSNFKRTLQTATPIAEKQEHCSIIALPEFNEIDSGICEGLTYQEINTQMPEIARARKENKYQYIYPKGEGYVSMERRIHRGIQKVLYLNNYDDNIMIVGHQAVNRMILSYFVFRQQEEVPYIYMPQNRFYHIQIDPHKKTFELKSYQNV